MRPTCVIAGCGYVGRRLAHRLRPGWEVIALLRTAAGAAALRDVGITALCVDLDESATHGRLQAAADQAAVAYLVPPPDQGVSDPRLERFLAALGDAQPATLLYMSTTGVYGDRGGATVDEETPPAPTNDRSRRRLAAECIATRWCAQRNVRSVVLRVPGIFGPGRLPLERLSRGEPALRHPDAGPGNRIHVDDLVTCCVAALERPISGVVNVCDDDHSSTTLFLETTARLAGLPPPPLLPMAEARERMGPGLMAFLAESRRVDNRRMREQLEVRSRFANLEDAIAASLDRRPDTATR